MNRGIKFEYIILEDEVIVHKQILTLEEIGASDELDESVLEKCHKVIKRQFTGLKDKNGKDIYEGDIVEFCSEYKFEIIWNQEYGAFSLKNTHPNDNYFRHMQFYDPTKDLEIIGNKFENPEFLTTQSTDKTEDTK